MRKIILNATLNVGLCMVLSAGVAGCKAKPTVTDAALTETIQSQLASDSALAGQQVNVSVQNGAVTLTGTLANEAERTISARDAAGVTGVKEVINATTLGSANAAAMTPAPVTSSVSAPTSTPAPARTQLPLKPRPNEPAPIERMQQQPPPPPVQQAAVAPPPPPQPVFRNLTVAAGESVPVRVTQTLDSATTQQGDSFSGVVASDVVEEGVVVIPAGTAVSGQVDVVHEAGHFKGASLLTVSLNGMTRHGQQTALSTDPYSVKGKGRGANTAEKAGGGAAVGAILGGIFGGGKGAAIGAAAGGGVGAGSNAITRGQQIQIPSETVVRFQLSAPVTLKVRVDGPSHDGRRELHPDGN